ncbi:18724_t:CDS:1, partial [Racocetra persica]
LTHIAPNIKVDELHLKILDVTLSMRLKNEDDENDIYSIDEIKEELFILEEN